MNYRSYKLNKDNKTICVVGCTNSVFHSKIQNHEIM